MSYNFSTYGREEPPQRRVLAAAGVTYLILFAAGVASGGELRHIALASLNTLPFAGLALFAYLGLESFNWARVVAGLWLTALLTGSAFVAIMVSIAALAETPLGSSGDFKLEAGAPLRIVLLFGSMTIAFIAGLATMMPTVRRLLSRRLPLKSESFVHTIALIAIVGITLIFFAPLLALGKPALLDLIKQTQNLPRAEQRSAAGMLRDQVYSLVWTVPAVLIAVGYGVTRSLPAALERLGLVRPTLRQIGAAVAIALLLVVAVQLLGSVIAWLWGLAGWPQTDEKAFSELISFALNPLGALVLGVTAGLGEELAVRGVLQPRLGILLSNLFFTSLHALQYNWDALIVVFVVGIVCGLVRRRTNTSTAAIVHGVYNFTLVILALVWK